MIVIFAGTTEGRLLAEHLVTSGKEVTVCVATEYGEKLMPDMHGLIVRSGRMDAQEMELFLQEKHPDLVVDATHPYAQIVSETIKQVCGGLQMECVRLLRETETMLPADHRIHIVDHTKEAAELAQKMTGNIFLTTGSKELSVFADTITDFDRLYARVLSTEESFAICTRLGLEGKHLICMQGPFSRELNRAMYVQTGARILITKESGDNGGFSDKVLAALDLDMQCIVIRRPAENGYSFEQVCEKLGLKADNHVQRKLFLIGIGMGSLRQMTNEACHTLEEVQVIFGAKRMLQAVSSFSARQVCEYRKDAIEAYLCEHPDITRAAVVFSGDVGFYSGAEAFGDYLDCREQRFEVCRIAGISSVNYFAARLGIAWQDVKLCSVHGRDMDLLAEIRQHQRVFTLLNGAEQLLEIASKLTESERTKIHLFVGYDLGYDTEEIWSGSIQEFCDCPARKGMCVAIFENKQVKLLTRTGRRADDRYAYTVGYATTGNYKDDDFIRGSVPLTKEEIRAIALSKLRLTSDAICYDIGAGTGGMTMDIARFVPDGIVYAFEHKKEACDLIQENKQKFHAENVQIVHGEAPEILSGYEAPTHAFIGGSGGNLQQIVEALLEKNPGVRIVIDAITLETIADANDLLKRLPVKDAQIVSATVAKAKTVGTYHLMESINPVYIFSFSGI